MANPVPSYLLLAPRAQLEILTSIATHLGVRAEILEKDIWLCLALEQLFQLQGAMPMIFKGGTSLSKVYRAIERFSEDVDVTIDWRALHPQPPSAESMKNYTKTKLGVLSKQIVEFLTAHIEQVLKPEMLKALTAIRADITVEFEIGLDGEPRRDKLRIFYPAVAERNDYIKPSILIEFGARNAIEPGETHILVPDVAEHVPAVAFPSAKVEVLSPQRTFWEKATLIHDECHRPAERAKASAARMSRHWYDLARLADQKIGHAAVENFELLRHVIAVKKQFFSYGFSRYDLCNTGGLQLIPDGALLNALSVDYQAMLDAGMFYGKAPQFKEIVARLQALQQEINERASKIDVPEIESII